MIRLLIDQGLPCSTAVLLRETGADVVHVGEIGAAMWTDHAILELAQEEGRTVVTLDADFHMLLALSRATSPSVIRLRVEGLRGRELARLIQSVVNTCGEELSKGVAVTVRDGRLRIRSLPLVP